MFKLTSAFEPTGDQPEAIKELTQGLLDEVRGRYYWELQDRERHLRLPT